MACEVNLLQYDPFQYLTCLLTATPCHSCHVQGYAGSLLLGQRDHGGYMQCWFDVGDAGWLAQPGVWEAALRAEAELGDIGLADLPLAC